MSLPDLVQKEVARIREMITVSKNLLPNSNVNFAFYEMVLAQADKAVREQDAVSLVELLPQLKEMS